MRNHENYEKLCALAATAQISEVDSCRLQEHLSACSACRAAMRDFNHVSILMYADGAEADQGNAPDGMVERLIARAQLETMSLSGGTGGTARPSRDGAGHSIWSSTKSVVVPAIAVSLLILAFVVTRYVTIRDRTASKSRAEMTPAVSVATANDDAASAPMGLRYEIERLTRELNIAREQRESLSRQTTTFREQLAFDVQREAELQSRVEALQTANDQLRNKESKEGAELAQLRQQLNELRSDQISSRAATALEQANLRAENDKLQSDLVEQHRLNTANAPCSSGTARKLHVIEVHDADSVGKEFPTYGRVFYAEKKCLAFYVFDLPNGSISQKVAFYGWGGKANKTQVKSLGIFHLDDPNDGRWVLTFEDPQVLSEITTVFVTRESDTTMAARPHGKRILETYLDNPSKHL